MAEPGERQKYVQIENNGKLYTVPRDKISSISPYVSRQIESRNVVVLEMDRYVFLSLFNVLLGGMDVEKLTQCVNTRNFIGYKRALRLLELPRTRINEICFDVCQNLNVTNLRDVMGQIGPQMSPLSWNVFQGFVSTHIFKIVRSKTFKSFDFNEMKVIFEAGYFRDESDSAIVLNEWFKANPDVYLYDLMQMVSWCQVKPCREIAELYQHLEEMTHLCRPGACVTGNCRFSSPEPKLIAIPHTQVCHFKCLKGRKWIDLGEFVHDTSILMNPHFFGYLSDIQFDSNRRALRIDWESKRFRGATGFVESYNLWNARLFASDQEDPMECYLLEEIPTLVPIEDTFTAKTHVIDCVMGRFFKIMVGPTDKLYVILNLKRSDMFVVDKELTNPIHCAVVAREVYIITPTRYFIIWDPITRKYIRLSPFDHPKAPPFNYNKITIAPCGWDRLALANLETGDVRVFSLETKNWAKLPKLGRNHYIAKVWMYDKSIAATIDSYSSGSEDEDENN